MSSFFCVSANTCGPLCEPRHSFSQVSGSFFSKQFLSERLKINIFSKKKFPKSCISYDSGNFLAQ